MYFEKLSSEEVVLGGIRPTNATSREDWWWLRPTVTTQASGRRAPQQPAIAGNQRSRRHQSRRFTVHRCGVHGRSPSSRSLQRILPCGGDPYSGIDRFGRVFNQKWVSSSDGTMTDEFVYTYDKTSNRASKTDPFLSSQGINSDNYLYAYDTMNRLIEAKSNISTGNTNGTAYQSWALDAAGDMTQIQTASKTDDNCVYNTLNQTDRREC